MVQIEIVHNLCLKVFTKWFELIEYFSLKLETVQMFLEKNKNFRLTFFMIAYNL